MNIHALLIGINYYLPNRLSNGLYYKSLAGCVQDVTRVEQFLRNRRRHIHFSSILFVSLNRRPQRSNSCRD